MRVFVSTADASGDLHAAALVEALRRQMCARDGVRAPGVAARGGMGAPGDASLEVFGLGGDALIAAGLEPIVRQSELAVGGLVEVLSSAPGILRAYRALRAAVLERAPDLVILVDSPDLNLRLAAVAKRAGRRVLYYIAPQVWAWRPGRVRQLRRRTDHVGVIFPFEAPLLRAAGVKASFVGHPLVDRMAEVRAKLRPAETARELGLDLERPVLGLLPGSRRNEFDANLPCLLETAELLQRAIPEVQTRLLLAPTLESMAPALPEHVGVIRGHSHAALALCTCAIVAPGTVTIEAALLGVPMVVAHRIHPLSFELFRRLARVPSSCMVNLLAGAGVVPERVQWQSRPGVLVSLVARLLRDPEARQDMQRQLADVAKSLGERGAAERAADLALEVAGKA